MIQKNFQLKNHIINYKNSLIKELKSFLKRPLVLEIFTGAFFSLIIICLSVSGQEKEVLKEDFNQTDDYIASNNYDVDADYEDSHEDLPGWNGLNRGDALSEQATSSSASSSFLSNSSATSITAAKSHEQASEALILLTPAPALPDESLSSDDEEYEELPDIPLEPDMTPEPTPEVILDPNGPVISCSIEDGHFTNAFIESISVTGYNSFGDKLPKDNIFVFLNDIKITPEMITERTISYLLEYTEGTNLLQIVVKDENSVSKYYEYKITYQKNSEPTAVISVDADSIGMGYIIPPTATFLNEGKTVASYVRELLKANSYSVYSSGSQNNNYVLKGIYRSDLYNKHSPMILSELSDYLYQTYNDLSIVIDDHYTNFIKNAYFTKSSKWIIEINGERYFDYMSNHTLNDGDILKVRFSLTEGTDLEWLKTYYSK